MSVTRLLRASPTLLPACVHCRSCARRRLAHSLSLCARAPASHRELGLAERLFVYDDDGAHGVRRELDSERRRSDGESIWVMRCGLASWHVRATLCELLVALTL